VMEDRCDIVDYKTGKQHEYHDEQLRTYALLWALDEEANPNGLPVGRLIVSYVELDRPVQPPTRQELDSFETDLRGRIKEAEGELGRRPPRATLPSTCNLCAVRHLCDDYWSSSRSVPSKGETFGDFQVLVTGRNGPRSWAVTVEADSTSAIIRTPTEEAGFGSGDRLRALGVAFSSDEDGGNVILTITQNSEVFLLA